MPATEPKTVQISTHANPRAIDIPHPERMKEYESLSAFSEAIAAIAETRRKGQAGRDEVPCDEPPQSGNHDDGDE